jgi:radical SAM superfamily enzyme YgiQ (UPF0313 family)
MQKRYRRRSAQNVVDEMIHMNQDYGIQDFLVVDDAFGCASNQIMRPKK